jgi:hypothetical protein
MLEVYTKLYMIMDYDTFGGFRITRAVKWLACAVALRSC